MIKLYEQMREAALSDKLTKVGVRGVGILVQRGIANWLDLTYNFVPPVKLTTSQNHSKSAVLPIANTMNVDLTNILAEITLKKVREQIHL